MSDKARNPAATPTAAEFLRTAESLIQKSSRTSEEKFAHKIINGIVDECKGVIEDPAAGEVLRKDAAVFLETLPKESDKFGLVTRMLATVGESGSGGGGNTAKIEKEREE